MLGLSLSLLIALQTSARSPDPPKITHMSLVAGPHASTHGRRATPASMHHPTVFGPHASTHDHLLSYQLVSGPHASLHGRRTTPSDHAQPTVFGPMQQHTVAGPSITAPGRRTSQSFKVVGPRTSSQYLQISSNCYSLLSVYPLSPIILYSAMPIITSLSLHCV